MNIGVLGLQGAFACHLDTLSDLGVAGRRIRRPEDLEGIDGVVLPGGESTTMSNLLVSSGLIDPLRSVIRAGLPTFGTCAGLILLARTVFDGRADQVNFGALDVTVRRNGYGRQVDSFESDLVVEGLERPFHAVFIRAPVIEEIAASVTVLASVDERPVLVRQQRVLASSFHPELTPDVRIHQLFIEMVRSDSFAGGRT